MTRLPEPLRGVLTSLPVFYLLEFLGRNPGAWENASGMSHRVGLSREEASQALEQLAAVGILEKQGIPEEPIYVLTADPTLRQQVVELANQANRTHEDFLAFVREILRMQLGQRHDQSR